MLTKNIAVLDTNVIIRFLINDNEELYNRSKEILSSIEAGRIKAKIIESVLAEIVFVLEKVYKVEREKICTLLVAIIGMHGLDQTNTLLYKQALDFYSNSKVDIVDSLLLAYQKVHECNILSFDRDVTRKLK
jgi:predicted nucleic-acid-binding protein